MSPSPVAATLELAIREHHVVEVDYRDRFGHAVTILAEPYGFRENRSGQTVLWVWNVERERFEELVVLRIAAARDTDLEFVPRRQWRGRLSLE